MQFVKRYRGRLQFHYMTARDLTMAGRRLAEATGGLSAQRSLTTRLRIAGLCLFSVFGFAGVARASQLRQVTIEAFHHYVALTEDRIESEIRDPSHFLWVDQQPVEQRQSLFEQLRQGQVITQRMETLENGQPIPVPQGMIHHWLATVFVPGVNLGDALAQQRDFNHGGQIYGPDIQDCKVLQADGNNFRVYYRFHRKVIVTANYNANFDIHFVPIDKTREYSRSYSTRIAEVVDPGTPDETERPVGIDRGYLWRLNTYTRYEERDGGVYIQTEFLALSRGVPAIFAWLVEPYVRSVPQDYLLHILGATRSDLLDPRTRAERRGALSQPPRRVPAAAGAAVNVKSY